MIDTTVDLTADILDVREIIERIEVLEGGDDDPESEDVIERTALEAIMADLVGMGGDEQWRGTWYPGSLVRDSYFEDYARELAEDIGAIPSDYSWPAPHIDWEAASVALQQDYSSVEIDGITYWTR